jgi:NADH-quinone oxidoreductase subunit N
MPAVLEFDLFALAPELALLATALTVLFVELFLSARRKQLVNPIAGIGILVAFGFVVALALDGTTRHSFGDMFVVDSYALLFKAFFLATAFFVLFLSYRYFQEIRTYQGEYYFLLLSAFIGMLLMPSARDLVMIFIALELVSVPGFVMAGLRKFDLRSNEGAMKFFLIGVLAVAVLLFGLSVIYGYSGTTNLVGVRDWLATGERSPLLLASVLFVIVGFGFKISAVPFHFWAPDTYEGSPIPVTAFLSVASKAAGFAGLLQVCFVAFEPVADVYGPVLGVVAVLTMTLGNLTALQQRNVVRLFAYSSVAHAGYMIVPFALVQPGEADLNSQVFASVMVYLLAYAAMNIGAFAVVTAVARNQPDRQIAGYAGLGQRNVGLALGFSVFLLSLGGVLPVVVGFWAKLYVLQATILEPSPGSVVLAAAVVVNSVIGAFYYLRLLRLTWFDEPAIQGPLRAGPALAFTVAVLAIVVVVAGVLPQSFTGVAESSTLAATAVP